VVEQLPYIGLAVMAGLISATQVGLIGAITRERGPFEATWLSMLGSLSGMALLLGILSLVGHSPNLPVPFGSVGIYVVLFLVMAGSLLMAGRGLSSYLLVTGTTAIPYLLAASWTSPRIGIAVFVAAVVTGQLLGSVALDHIGAFGAAPRPIDVGRGAGIVALILGIVLIRGRG